MQSQSLVSGVCPVNTYQKNIMNRRELLFFMIFFCFFTTKSIFATKLISNKEVLTNLSKVIESTKPTLPKIIDKNTILYDMKPFGLRGLEYFYKLNMAKEALLKIPDIQLILQNMQINNYCSNKALYWYRDEFISMKWSYFDENDIAIFSVRANPNDCPVLKASGYTTKNASATSNVFLLKDVISQFSVGDIITIGDSKKEYEIVEVKPLKKTGSGNSQTIILMDGVGFEINAEMKVSVVR